MAFYKLFLRPAGRCFHQNNLVIQIIENDAGSLKLSNLSRNKRYFRTSLDRRWGLKDLKSNSNESRSPDQLPGEELGTVTPPQFSLGLLVKPFLFTVAVSSASIAGSAIWQYENVRKRAILLMQRSWLTDGIFRKKKNSWRQEISKFWNNLTEGEKFFIPICCINVMVFLAWNVKRFRPTMLKYFSSSPFGESVCWPMFLTIFSHAHILHLCCNMYVLYSFSLTGVNVLGKEQFLGLYLSAGVISSFTSYVYKAIKSCSVSSVGASGAILGTVAYLCAEYPDMELSMIFLPGVTFAAKHGLKACMAFDFMGVIRGWKIFDHAAHLGGFFCGLGWYYWGNTHIWQKREPLLNWWHELRSPSK